MKRIIALLLAVSLMIGFGSAFAFAADDDMPLPGPETEEETTEADPNVYPRTKFQLIVAIIVRLFDKLIQLIQGNGGDFDLGGLLG